MQVTTHDQAGNAATATIPITVSDSSGSGGTGGGNGGSGATGGSGSQGGSAGVCTVPKLMQAAAYEDLGALRRSAGHAAAAPSRRAANCGARFCSRSVMQRSDQRRPWRSIAFARRLLEEGLAVSRVAGCVLARIDVLHVYGSALRRRRERRRGRELLAEAQHLAQEAGALSRLTGAQRGWPVKNSSRRYAKLPD